MSLALDDVRRIARLARIAVTDAELGATQAQLNGILAMIERMQRVPTEGVEPMSHAQDLVLHLREDVVTERDQRGEFLAIAPQTEAGLYLVPKVIE